MSPTMVGRRRKFFNIEPLKTPYNDILAKKFVDGEIKFAGLFQDISSIFHLSRTVFQDGFGFQDIPGHPEEFS